MAKTRAKTFAANPQEANIVRPPVYRFVKPRLEGWRGDYFEIFDNSTKVIKEDWVKEQVNEILEYYGVFSFMPQNVGLGVSGIPDFVGCRHGKFFSIETKRSNGGVVSALQWMQLNKINTAQGFAIVVDEYGLQRLFNLLKTIHQSEPDRIYDFRLETL